MGKPGSFSDQTDVAKHTKQSLLNIVPEGSLSFLNNEFMRYGNQEYIWLGLKVTQ